jgi:glycosyltransferase involved in cell wall biosynthesis
MLSVIVPTRNRASLLRLALQSLTKQTLPAERFEVLVVDNGSTDSTRQVVEEHQRQEWALRYFFEATPGLHAGRHRGLKEARGEVLVYADDDIEATPSWLEAIDECFRNPDVAMVGGNNYPRFEAPPPAWLARLWQRPAYGGRAITSLSVIELASGQRPISPFCVWGCNFSVRKRILLEAGGFHPDGMPEEQIRFRGDGETHVSAHVARSGLTCLFDSRASVYHAVTNSRMTFEYFRKRAFSQGISDSYTRLRQAGAGRDGGGRGKALRGALAAALRSARAWASELLSPDRELSRLARSMRAGYREGYEYHQRAYRSDPALQSWVHKPDYY